MVVKLPFSQYCSGCFSTGIKDEHVCKKEGIKVFKPTFVGKAGSETLARRDCLSPWSGTMPWSKEARAEEACMA